MKENLPEASIHIRVWGRVQGVGFRAFVREQAKLFNLSGWVRNVGRNQVEMRAEGRREAIEDFLVSVKKGPSVSNVRESKIEWGEFRGEFKKFKGKRSGGGEQNSVITKMFY